MHPLTISKVFVHRLSSIVPKSTFILFLTISIIFAHAAAAQSTVSDPVLRRMLESKDLKSALVGVYVYDDSSKKEIADFQSEKYFVPASNTKLFSLYAGMKYLGDSLEGIRYFENDTALFLIPTGDPSLLHPDYQSQPVVDFLKKLSKKTYLLDWGWQETGLGPGWAWDDYNDDYSVERSQLPVYGNFIRWSQLKSETHSSAGFGESTTASSSPEIPMESHFFKRSHK